VVAAPGALASGGVENWEDDAMTQDALWVTMLMGGMIGAVLGYAAAWRLARKLEAHGLTLRSWDEDDWQAKQEQAVGRLRKGEA
jgi:membrane protein DedA with SNARE-associated domain